MSRVAGFSTILLATLYSVIVVQGFTTVVRPRWEGYARNPALQYGECVDGSPVR